MGNATLNVTIEADTQQQIVAGLNSLLEGWDGEATYHVEDTHATRSMWGLEQTALDGLKRAFPDLQWKYISGSHIAVRVPSTTKGSYTYIELNTYYNGQLLPGSEEDQWYDKDDEPID